MEPPSIRRDLPLVRKVRVHQRVSLTVHAQGTGLTYQWTKYGTPLRDEDDGYQGVSTSSLTIRQASLEQSGEYQCVVENEGGSVTSSICKVTVGEIVCSTKSLSMPIYDCACVFYIWVNTLMQIYSLVLW